MSSSTRDDGAEGSPQSIDPTPIAAGSWKLATATGLFSWSDDVWAIYGRDPSSFAPRMDVVIAAHRRDDREAVARHLARTATLGGRCDFTAIVERLDGTQRRVVYRGLGKAQTDGAVHAVEGVIVDITPFDEGVRDARLDEFRARQLADAASDVITRLNGEFRRDYVSPACLRVFGFTVDEMMGGKPSDSIHPEDAAAVRSAAGRLLSGETLDGRTTLTYRAKHKLGHWVWVEAGLSLARGVGPVGGDAIIASLRDVTARRLSDARLEASEARYRLLAENATDMIAMSDASFRFTFVSPASVAIAGLGPDDLVGTPVASIVHEGDRPDVVAALSLVAAGLEQTATLHRIVRPDGSERWVDAAYRRVVDPTDGQTTGCLVATRDVTRRKEAKERLRMSEARYRVLAENTSEMIILGHDDGRRSYVSPASSRLLGYTPEEFQALGMRNYVHPDDLAGLYDMTRRLVESGVGEAACVFKARHKDKGWINVEGTFRRVRDARHEEPTIVATFRDVTAREAQSEALREAKIAAEKASVAKTDFLASMSHEIRTPLNGIIGYTDLLLEDGSLDVSHRRKIERIQGAGAALLTVVNDILDFSAIEAGHVEFSTARLSLVGLAESSTAIVDGLAAAKGLAMSIHIAQDVPHWIMGDEDRLRQILLNLLNNAVKFTASGSVTLGVEVAGEGGRRLRYSVTDTGIGIPADKRSRLFKRFSQADGSIRREFGGTGLGLAICKSLVELMGGVIGIDAPSAGGTRFWFELPLEAACAPASPTSIRKRPSGRGAFVLLVEDLEINQDIARSVLETAGHRVDVVGDGAEAVSAVLERDYDVVLMDVQMPGMDGLTATGLIKALPGSAAKVPIVAMTANVLPGQIAEFRAAGMMYHVGKPFRRDELCRVIDLAVGSDQASEDHAEAGEDVTLDVDARREMISLLGERTVDELVAKLWQQIGGRFSEERLAAGDKVALARDAHALVAASGMLGFRHFATTCAKLEAACRDDAPIPRILDTLRSAMMELSQVVGATCVAA